MEDLEKLPRTRKEGLEVGSKWYFTGKPCKRGHISKRYASAGCLECHKKEKRKWKRDNPEKVSQYAREYYERNKEKITRAALKWQQDNLEKVAQLKREWKRDNPEKVRELKRRRRARMRDATVETIPPEALQAVLQRQDNECPHTGLPFPFIPEIVLSDGRATPAGTPHLDHTTPLNQGGSHTLDNLQYLSPHANLTKRDKYERLVFIGEQFLGAVYGYTEDELDKLENKLIEETREV